MNAAQANADIFHFYEGLLAEHGSDELFMNFVGNSVAGNNGKKYMLSMRVFLRHTNSIWQGQCQNR